MTPKKYILSREGLNHSYFARKIGWNKAQLSQWLNNKGNIPPDKLKALEKELRKYGYIKSEINGETK